MKRKSFDAKLADLVDAHFILQYKQGKNGEKAATLTAPYLKYIESNKAIVLNEMFDVSGKELECIERNYFEKKLTHIPIQGYPVPVEMQDILYKLVPPEVYNQMLSNTFKISDDSSTELKDMFRDNLPQKNTKNYSKNIEIYKYTKSQRKKT